MVQWPVEKMLCAALEQNVPCSSLLSRLSSGCSSLRRGLVWYGVMVQPHGLLNLLEVWTLLMPDERRERRMSKTAVWMWFILRQCGKVLRVTDITLLSKANLKYSALNGALSSPINTMLGDKKRIMFKKSYVEKKWNHKSKGDKDKWFYTVREIWSLHKYLFSNWKLQCPFLFCQ